MLSPGSKSPLMMSIGLYARWIGQAGRTHALREAGLERGVWFARRRDIADWFWTNYPHLDDSR
jgi:hypothetical protein